MSVEISYVSKLLHTKDRKALYRCSNAEYEHRIELEYLKTGIHNYKESVSDH